MHDKASEILIEEVTEALSQIKEQFRIDDDRFIKGYIFVRAVMDGVRVNSAYAEAFEVSLSSAKTLSTQLYRTKWIQAIISELEVDTEVRDREFIEEAKETLSAAMSEDGVDIKDRIAAARGMGAIIKDTKKQEKQEQREGSNVADILKQIQEAAQKGQILSPERGIIDVKAIEE